MHPVVGKPKVWNKRDPNTPKFAVYVGRPSLWGNPYTHLPTNLESIPVANRDEAVRRYREDLMEMRMKDPAHYHAFLKPLRGKHLVCWCAPHACHANVLLELANEGPDEA